jgi:shikimate dehydrogenase
MKPELNKDTRLCISLAARPSNFGTRFHNHLYAELGLDFVYKAFTTTDIVAAIGGVRALGIRGCSVSMPFKEEVIALVDELDESATAIQSVNTIVNDDGHLRAANTDYIAIAQLIAEHSLDPSTPLLLRGSGGMAKAVAAAFRDAGFSNGTIIARNAQKGRALAAEVGFSWVPEQADLRAPLLVNVTPLGMVGDTADVLSFTTQSVAEAQTVFDVVAVPERTPLIAAATEAGIAVITGADVIALQAAEQFALYTGVRPTRAQVRAASTVARR